MDCPTGLLREDHDVNDFVFLWPEFYLAFPEEKLTVGKIREIMTRSHAARLPSYTAAQ